MECTVSWTGKTGSRSAMAFVAETGSGHALNMDGAPEAGGANLAARPMEMLLIGAGGCSASDVLLILQRGRHAVNRCSVHIQAERADEIPRVFTRIHLHFVVQGYQLNPKVVARAVALSHEKYCSATIMLGASAHIETSYEVLQEPQESK